MLSVALTGSIATGKSSAAEAFRQCGAHIIDADSLSRAVVQPGQAGLQRVVTHFGRGVLRPDGNLDRVALGELVFSDPARRRLLDRLLHPLIMDLMEKRLHAIGRDAPDAIVVVEVPLLIEGGFQDRFDAVVLVAAPRDLQKARLMARNGLDAQAADLRLRSQLDVDSKRAFADFVIENDASPEDLQREVARVYGLLQVRAAGRC